MFYRNNMFGVGSHTSRMLRSLGNPLHVALLPDDQTGLTRLGGLGAQVMVLRYKRILHRFRLTR